MQLCVKFVLNISDKGILWQSDQPPPHSSTLSVHPFFLYTLPDLQDERMRVKSAWVKSARVNSAWSYIASFFNYKNASTAFFYVFY